MKLVIGLVIALTFVDRVSVSAWAQARVHPVCHHHARLPYPMVAAEGRQEDATLLPIQHAAGLLGMELRAAKLLPESAEAVAAFALRLLAIFDDYHGQCPVATSRDSLTHHLCAAYIEYEDRILAACMGRITNGGALRCLCDEYGDDIVAICRSHTSPCAHDRPICHNSHARGCRTAWSGLCSTTPHPRRVRQPPRARRTHASNGTTLKHSHSAAQAQAQGASRWGIRAAQRMAVAARRPTAAAAKSAQHIAGPHPPKQSRLSFLFLLAQSVTLNTISAAPPTDERQIKICSTGPAALAAARVALPQSWVSHRVSSDDLSALITHECDGLATWPAHAESLFTNPCVNGAASHALCAGAAHDHPAFAVGARLFMDPHTSTVQLPHRGLVLALAAEAEHHKLHTATCAHMHSTSGHHHLPHC